MKKFFGIVMISVSIVLAITVIGYTIIFSYFGLESGGTILLILPLIIIAVLFIIALVFLFRAGIRYVKGN